jgi:glucan-binding YG repeat protein
VEQEKIEKKTSSLIKAVIAESKKIREERGEDLFSNRKTEPEKLTSQIQISSDKTMSNEVDFKNLRDSHSKLANLIADNEKKNFDKNDQVLPVKKARSKSVHLYIDEKIEHFLKAESEKSDTKWGLRKNAGLGNLIQKFILNFIELKKREERQLKRVKKVIAEFQIHIVEFKKYSGIDPNKAEEANQKMKTLSNDLNILLALLEFEEGAMKTSLGNDSDSWLYFILKWKHQV